MSNIEQLLTKREHINTFIGQNINNKICDVIITNPIKDTKKNCISTIFFTTSKGFTGEDGEAYTDGLLKSVEQMNDLLGEDWVYRIYVDRSLDSLPQDSLAIKTLNKLVDMKMVQICLVTCHDQLQEDKRFHTDMFMTLMRMFAIVDPTLDYVLVRNSRNPITYTDAYHVKQWMEYNKNHGDVKEILIYANPGYKNPSCMRLKQHSGREKSINLYEEHPPLYSTDWGMVEVPDVLSPIVPIVQLFYCGLFSAKANTNLSNQLIERYYRIIMEEPVGPDGKLYNDLHKYFERDTINNYKYPYGADEAILFDSLYDILYPLKSKDYNERYIERNKNHMKYVGQNIYTVTTHIVDPPYNILLPGTNFYDDLKTHSTTNIEISNYLIFEKVTNMIAVHPGREDIFKLIKTFILFISMDRNLELTSLGLSIAQYVTMNFIEKLGNVNVSEFPPKEFEEFKEEYSKLGYMEMFKSSEVSLRNMFWLSYHKMATKGFVQPHTILYTLLNYNTYIFIPKEFRKLFENVFPGVLADDKKFQEIYNYIGLDKDDLKVFTNDWEQTINNLFDKCFHEITTYKTNAKKEKGPVRLSMKKLLEIFYNNIKELLPDNQNIHTLIYKVLFEFDTIAKQFRDDAALRFNVTYSEFYNDIFLGIGNYYYEGPIKDILYEKLLSLTSFQYVEPVMVSKAGGSRKGKHQVKRSKQKYINKRKPIRTRKYKNKK